MQAGSESESESEKSGEDGGIGRMAATWKAIKVKWQGGRKQLAKREKRKKKKEKRKKKTTTAFPAYSIFRTPVLVCRIEFQCTLYSVLAICDRPC